MRSSEVFDPERAPPASLSDQMSQPSDFLNQPKTTNLNEP